VDDTRFILQIQVDCGEDCPYPESQKRLGCQGCPRLDPYLRTVLEPLVEHLIADSQMQGYRIIVNEKPESFWKPFTCYRVSFSILVQNSKAP
jgi:hypothetical protein